MPLEFVLSQKNNNLLKFGGYLHSFYRKNKLNFVWKCSRVKNCNGLVYTNLDNSNGEIHCEILTFGDFVLWGFCHTGILSCGDIVVGDFVAGILTSGILTWNRRG